jgi:hypothetical protein
MQTECHFLKRQQQCSLLWRNIVGCNRTTTHECYANFKFFKFERSIHWRMDAETHFTKASQFCKSLWPMTMFAPLVMLQWLLQRNGQSWVDFVWSAEFQCKRKIFEEISPASIDDLKPLWKCHTGGSVHELVPPCLVSPQCQLYIW